MALPLTNTDKFLLLHALGAPESRDRVVALLDLAGTGNVMGPGSAANNALVRFDGTTGALIQNSGVILDGSNNLSGIALLSAVSANLSGLTASTVLQTDASKNLQSSSVTTATLAFLDATSSVQTQLNAKAPTASPSFTGQILSANGSPAAPVYSFTSDPDTGIYRVTANTLGFSSNGAQVGKYFSDGDWFFGLPTVATSTVRAYGSDLHLNEGGVASTRSAIYTGATDGSLELSGGSSYPSVNSSGVRFFGSTNATPNITQFFNNATQSGSISSAGLWTIGASGGTQTHAINGAITVNTAGSYILGTQTTPLLIKSIAANSNGLRLYSNTITDAASVVNGYNAALELGTNNTVYQTISNTGLITLGASGGTQNHVVNGILTVRSVSGPTLIVQDTGTFGTNADPYISFKDGTVSGAELGFAGAAENNFYIKNIRNGIMYFATNDTFMGNISATGKWTIGESSGAQIHQINGATEASAAAVMTMTNGPTNTAGNPDIFIKINYNGTVYVIPAWTP